MIKVHIFYSILCSEVEILQNIVAFSEYMNFNVCLIYAVRSRLTELGADKNEEYEKMHSTLKKNFKRNYIMPTDSI